VPCQQRTFGLRMLFDKLSQVRFADHVHNFMLAKREHGGNSKMIIFCCGLLG
jgi:hypothetical protein